MTELDLLALDLGANSRTLRRAARRGAIRVHRVSPNKPTIDLAERRYLDAHWPLLAKLARALRTEKNVRLAVLFGSAARGDDRPGSDVDLLVDLGDYGRRLPIARLELRLEEALGRPVQVVALRDAQASPALLSEAVADGRVIVDRDGGWLRLKRRKPRLRRLASRLRGANARAGPARARGARRAVTGSTPQLPRAIAERLRDLRLQRHASVCDGRDR